MRGSGTTAAIGWEVGESGQEERQSRSNLRQSGADGAVLDELSRSGGVCLAKASLAQRGKCGKLGRTGKSRCRGKIAITRRRVTADTEREDCHFVSIVGGSYATRVSFTETSHPPTGLLRWVSRRSAAGFGGADEAATVPAGAAGHSGRRRDRMHPRLSPHPRRCRNQRHCFAEGRRRRHADDPERAGRPRFAYVRPVQSGPATDARR